MVDQEIVINELSQRDITRIKQLLNGGQNRSMATGGARGGRIRDDYHLVLPAADIPAATIDAGNVITPGKLDCTIYRATNAPPIFTPSATEGQREVFNVLTLPLPANFPTPVHRDWKTGWWMAHPNFVEDVKIGTADADIQPGLIGGINIYRKPLAGGAKADIGENINAWHDHITGGVKVSKDDEVVITYFWLERVWRITGAPC